MFFTKNTAHHISDRWHSFVILQRSQVEERPVLFLKAHPSIPQFTKVEGKNYVFLEKVQPVTPFP